MQGSAAGGRQPKGLSFALSIQSALRKFAALDFPSLVARTMLTEGQVREGLRFSRRNKNSKDLANEIVAATKALNGSWVYFLAKNDAQAASYQHHRKMIALGHIQSVILLEEKRHEKWPSPQRVAAIKMLEMAHQLLSTAP